MHLGSPESVDSRSRLPGRLWIFYQLRHTLFPSIPPQIGFPVHSPLDLHPEWDLVPKHLFLVLGLRGQFCPRTRDRRRCVSNTQGSSFVDRLTQASCQIPRATPQLTMGQRGYGSCLRLRSRVTSDVTQAIHAMWGMRA